LAGHALAGKFLHARFERFSGKNSFVDNGLYRMILAVVSIVIGLINLFPTRPGDIAILGELLPSSAGIVAGVLLLLEYSRSRRDTAKTKDTELAEKVEKIAGPPVSYLSAVGIGSMIIGILHAMFPKIPLL